MSNASVGAGLTLDDLKVTFKVPVMDYLLFCKCSACCDVRLRGRSYHKRTRRVLHTQAGAAERDGRPRCIQTLDSEDK